MLDILCQLPAPCGNEETVKKYIKTKVCTTEDSIGNLIARKKDGNEKRMIFGATDEDALTVMQIDGKKLFVSHQGVQKIPLGSLVSFGGYMGVLQAKDSSKPTENLYVEMLKDGFEKVGASGVVSVEYTTEDEIVFTKDVADKMALSAMLKCTDEETDYDTSFVFGVQSKNKNKGAIVASRALAPDFVLAFEKTKAETLTYKAASKGFIISQKAKEEIESICDALSIEIKPEADTEAESAASAFAAANVIVIGVPVRFYDEIRQAADIKYEEILQKIIKAFLKEGK